MWYNYTTTSAGTISGTSNTNATTESICPKGWNLPSKKQIDSISGGSSGSTTYVSSFSPILGGYYYNGGNYNKSMRGYWWGIEASDSVSRYFPYYYNSKILTGIMSRFNGNYIRCVSEEKDVSDLTYMQTKTPSTANKHKKNTSKRCLCEGFGLA